MTLSRGSSKQLADRPPQHSPNSSANGSCLGWRGPTKRNFLGFPGFNPSETSQKKGVAEVGVSEDRGCSCGFTPFYGNLGP